MIVADGSLSRFGRALGTGRNRDWPQGMALRGYYRSPRNAEAYIDSFLDIRDASGRVVPGYGWIFPLGDGRVNVGVGLLSTQGRGKHVNTTKLMDDFVAQVPASWCLDPRDLLRRTDRRPPAHGPRASAHASARTAIVVGDAAGVINPFNGEGIAYALRDGPAGRRPRSRTRSRRATRGCSPTTSDPCRTSTACTTGWPGPSSACSRGPG